MAHQGGPKGLERLIRAIPDHPKPGIRFRDITPLLQNRSGFDQVISNLVARYRQANFRYVAAIEARGFLFGAPLARELGCGLIPVRKSGKLPSETVSERYDLEYGTDTLEIHADALSPGDRVLLVDDVLATGGTALAAARLLRKLQADLPEFACVIELSGLPGRNRLTDEELSVHALMVMEA